MPPERRRKADLVDRVVVDYWTGQRQAIERLANSSYSPRRYEQDLQERVRERRGLLGAAQTAVHYPIKFIAAGCTKPGLEHARWAVRLAELALEVGDLGIYEDNAHRPSRDLSLSWLHEYMYYGKWLLGQEGADTELELCLRHRITDWDRIWPETVPLDEPRDQETGIWSMVMPLLLGGWIEESARWFAEIAGQVKCDPMRIGRNAANLHLYLAVLLAYLEGTVSEDQARRTAEAFQINISGWGHKGRSVRARLWKQFLPSQHVMLAQVRARYFTKDMEAVSIVQSIRGIPV